MKPSSQTSLLLLSSVFRRDWSSQRSISFRVGRKPVACFISQGEVWLEVNGESGRMMKGQLNIWTSGSEIRVTYRSGELQGYVLFLQHLSLAKRRNEWGLSPDSEFMSFLHASGRLPSEDALRLREVQLADLHRRFRSRMAEDGSDLQAYWLSLWLPLRLQAVHVRVAASEAIGIEASLSNPQ